jgi:DivIVA domain-containing protein
VTRGRIAAVFTVVTLLGVLGVLVVLFLAGVVATRGDALLADAPPDAADVVLPPGRVSADDVRGVRFGLALRGYRMSEVDAVLDRLAAELADRDAQLAAHDAVTAPVAPTSAAGEDGP